MSPTNGKTFFLIVEIIANFSVLFSAFPSLFPSPSKQFFILCHASKIVHENFQIQLLAHLLNKNKRRKIFFYFSLFEFNLKSSTNSLFQAEFSFLLILFRDLPTLIFFQIDLFCFQTGRNNISREVRF